MHSLGMKFVLHSCLLLYLFSYSTLQQSSNYLTVQLPPDSLRYIVQLNLPQHNQSLSLALDIAQGLTLTQTCNDQTFGSPIRCNETECLEFFRELNTTSPMSLVQKQPTITKQNRSSRTYFESSNTCDYQFQFPEYNGTLTKVDLNGFLDFVLGCGHKAEGAPPPLGYDIDGVLGLGKGRLSFLAQTNNTRFSYCLPSGSNSTGYFTFGHDNNDDDDASLSFTLLRDDVSDYYVVDIVAISINGTQLPIAYENINGTIIDTGAAHITGTIIDTGAWLRLSTTRLPPASYMAMRDEFTRQMGTYPIAKLESIFDTCYYISDDFASVPTVSFTFWSGVTVDLDASQILYAVDQMTYCFAFTQAMESDPTDFVIFASAQQRTLEMVFDVANDKFGFRQNGCA